MALSSDYDYDLRWIHNESGLNAHPEGDVEFQVYAAACYSLIFCISLPGNSFLLWVLLKERAWRTTRDIFLLQLAVSNLCSTATLPFMASNDLHSWGFEGWACGALRALHRLGWTSYPIIVTAMVLHSYITVVHASRVSAQAFSKRRVLVGSIVMWLACAAVAVGFATMCFSSPSVFMLYFDTYFHVILLFLLPLAIVTFCYVHLWITIRQGRINRQDQPSKLILGITVGYFLCVAPHTIIAFIAVVLPTATHILLDQKALLYALLITYPLIHFYCLLYPLVYIPGAQRFRRHLPQRCHRSGDDEPVAVVNLLETTE
ncbi:chemokine XC receptor 1-like [Stegastes partitus]|nr:PREDICTED: chemokine XC receptor 1-like [Stegastes partitus]XP_008285714.1 PREDICTED: chemokine XC receptor 1-like [Stegastes partitus]XP_008285715.1 PREDICTED: chemokine XC receptor 1-like [Stegastes partitus]XP_008285716.1 PREDICTED: chemokine XC receptor 1-like [Stegastes partitus]XP_008285717.1 PREDICTED: chemokine XC receptor 1-like [Stegastes partitus]